MVFELKIKHKEIYPKGQLVRIAHEKERPFVNDDEIYFYIDDDKKLDDIKVGDKIMLDEEFEVMEIKK